MTEQIAHYPARCEGCDKAYRVPRTDRAYKCKACGGAIRAASDSRAGPLLEGKAVCTECDAINPRGMHFCVECGASLEESEARPGSDLATRYRFEANAALKRAYASINKVTVLYRVGAFAYAAAAIFAILALARTEVPREGGVLVVGLTTLLSVLLLMASMHILFKPLLWTVAIAVLATAVSVVHIFGPNPFGVAFIASAAWAALAWAAFVPTSRFQELIAKHKDLYILHHASAKTRRSLKGHSAHERHERLLDAMDGAARRAWRVSTAEAVAICVVSIAGTWTILTTARPGEFPPALERFETEWNSGNFAAVGELFAPESRALESARIAGLVEEHGWQDAPPRLEDGRTDEKRGLVSIEYELEAFTVSTRWMLVGTQWCLIAIELPVPPLEPSVERFVAAWENSDPKALAAFFEVRLRPQMIEEIEKSARKRKWKSFPKIQETRVGDYEEGESVVTMFVAHGTVTTKWQLRDTGRWGIAVVRFPKN